MNKRKIMTLALSLCMVAILAVGGSIAYLSDTDMNKNVMTVGNVYIDQIEHDSKGEDFKDGQKMYPVTGNKSTKAEKAEYGDVMADGQNWIDKIVTVENTGNEDAYIRTLFAFQMLEVKAEAKDAAGNVIIGEDGKPVMEVVGYMDPIDAFETKALDARTNHGLCYDWDPAANGDSLYWPLNSNDGMEYMSSVYGSGNDYTHLDLNGKKYVIAAYYYTNNGDSMLEPGQTSHPSLKAVGLESTVTNEQAAYFEDYEILVVSQGVQTTGFTTDANGNGSYCDDALNEAFGALETVDQATLQSWFSVESKEKSKD